MRSKSNRCKCKDKRNYSRTRRKFFGFVYRLQNKNLKSQEKTALRYCNYLEWLDECYAPLVHITAEEIEKYQKQSYIRDRFPFPCIYAEVEDPFASPYAGTGNGYWLIVKPGYYRVKKSFRTDVYGDKIGDFYTMPHYNGMPYFNAINSRRYNNYVSRAFHEVLEHYSKIEQTIHREKREIEHRKACTYNRLKNAQILKTVRIRRECKVQANRMRGVTPTKETINFFQAIAIGSAMKSKNR